MDFDHENVRIRTVMNADRLSSLPDELIHQILSCIDSKYAVQTCVLSSRWKFLWTSMPCLNFASGSSPMQLSNNGFHSLNNVDICLYIHRPHRLYNEEVVRKTINMLQEVQSARFLTLNADVVECISSCPELISQHPSPFSNLICLNIGPSKRKDAHKIKMSIEARNFLLENCPSATIWNYLRLGS